MKKVLIFLLIILVLAGGIYIFINNFSENTTPASSNSENNLPSNEKTSYNLDTIIPAIEDLGLTCEKNESLFSLVGATNGFKLKSQEKTLEIYQFDTNSDSYKLAESTQQLTLQSFNSTLPAVVKNGYAYLIDSDFPQYNEVITLLDNLK